VAVVAGIDEAGYGPLLGPLVVSGVAFEVPDEAAGDDLWTRLAGVVTRSPRDADRVAVNDSKRLFDQSRGLRHIERTALAFAAAAGLGATTFRSLLGALADVADDLDAYPWHSGVDFPVPLAADPARLAVDAQRLASAEGGRFLGVRAHPVLVGEFNRHVESVGTKAATLFAKTALLLARFWRDWGDRGLIVHVDKHGGRNRYGLLLHQTFFGARVRTLVEGAEESVYEISDGARRMTVGFYVRGDSGHLPVALASIFSKYLRELFMHSFNAYWQRHVPDLVPTAGYYTDGQRFLRDIADARRRLAIPDHLLIRNS
jgi:ribonuclease HII